MKKVTTKQSQALENKQVLEEYLSTSDRERNATALQFLYTYITPKTVIYRAHFEQLKYIDKEKYQRHKVILIKSSPLEVS